MMFGCLRAEVRDDTVVENNVVRLSVSDFTISALTALKVGTQQVYGYVHLLADGIYR